MENVENILGMAKVHGNGRVQIPIKVRELLSVDDGDYLVFVLGTDGRVYVRRAYTSPFAEIR